MTAKRIQEPKATFKSFVERIAQAKNSEDAIQNIFYGQRFDEDGNVTRWGIDYAYQRGKITYADLELLLKLCEKLEK